MQKVVDFLTATDNLKHFWNYPYNCNDSALNGLGEFQDRIRIPKQMRWSLKGDQSTDTTFDPPLNIARQFLWKHEFCYDSQWKRVRFCKNTKILEIRQHWLAWAFRVQNYGPAHAFR